LLDQIALLEQQVREVDAAIAELLAGHDQHLDSIPGLGPVLAATILAEIGDIHRFRSLGALVAYAGLDPSVFASGQFVGKRQRLSKRGSPYLRRAVFLATHSAQFRNPDLAADLQRKLTECKPDKAAVIATAHKLPARIHVVLKQGRPFEVRSLNHRSLAGLDIAYLDSSAEGRTRNAGGYVQQVALGHNSPSDRSRGSLSWQRSQPHRV
jgi:transposase